MFETETPGSSPAPDEMFRVAMRGLASGVSLVTARSGAERTGCVVSSLVSLNLQPPTLLLTLLQGNSTARLIGETGRFGVSLAAASQRATVENFIHAPSGEPRFALGRWREAAPAVPGCSKARSPLSAAASSKQCSAANI